MKWYLADERKRQWRGFSNQNKYYKKKEKRKKKHARFVYNNLYRVRSATKAHLGLILITATDEFSRKKSSISLYCVQINSLSQWIMKIQSIEWCHRTFGLNLLGRSCWSALAKCNTNLPYKSHHDHNCGERPISNAWLWCLTERIQKKTKKAFVRMIGK